MLSLNPVSMSGSGLACLSSPEERALSRTAMPLCESLEGRRSSCGRGIPRRCWIGPNEALQADVLPCPGTNQSGAFLP